jgi:hypothetical protein
MRTLAASIAASFAVAISDPVSAADHIYHHDNVICLCTTPLDIGNIITGFTAGPTLTSWIENLKLRSKSKFNYYVGSGLEGGFGADKGVRFTVILPSEYIRDSTDEWDMFQLILTYQNPNNPKAAIWLTTKNYMHRLKGGFPPQSPSPDWEYSAAENLDASNARLEVIASVLKQIAEANSDTVIIKQDDEPKASK